jgi:urease accessory protein
VNAVAALDLPEDLPLPVAVGGAARGLALDDATVVRLYLHNIASNLVTNAVRFVPLGQAEGQRVLSDLHAEIDEIAVTATTLSLVDIRLSAFGADLHAMEHEVMDVRIFKT